MTVESTTQAICDLALRFGEGEEESMVSIFDFCYYYQHNTTTGVSDLLICSCSHDLLEFLSLLLVMMKMVPACKYQSLKVNENIF
jgi:hypothetical protein